MYSYLKFYFYTQTRHKILQSELLDVYISQYLRNHNKMLSIAIWARQRSGVRDKICQWNNIKHAFFSRDKKLVTSLKNIKLRIGTTTRSEEKPKDPHYFLGPISSSAPMDKQSATPLCTYSSFRSSFSHCISKQAGLLKRSQSQICDAICNLLCLRQATRQVSLRY